MKKLLFIFIPVVFICFFVGCKKSDYRIAYENGYNHGKDKGYQEGYDDGYTLGYQAALNKYEITE